MCIILKLWISLEKEFEFIEFILCMYHLFRIGGFRTTFLLFPDDTVLLASSNSDIHEMMDENQHL